VLLGYVWANRAGPSRKERIVNITGSVAAIVSGGGFTLIATVPHHSWLLPVLMTMLATLTLIVTLAVMLAAMDVDRIADTYAKFCARRLTGVATLLAGRKRPRCGAEWHAHLAGESGHDPITWRKVREALGFVASAFKYRLADTADAAWTPVDAVLKSRTLSNLLVFGPTITAALFILHQAGKTAVVTSAGGILAVGGALYTLVRTGRWWRNVKPPEPKARRVKE
jgi:hypothetical protein